METVLSVDSFRNLWEPSWRPVAGMAKEKLQYLADALVDYQAGLMLIKGMREAADRISTSFGYPPSGSGGF